MARTERVPDCVVKSERKVTESFDILLLGKNPINSWIKTTTRFQDCFYNLKRQGPTGSIKTVRGLRASPSRWSNLLVSELRFALQCGNCIKGKPKGGYQMQNSHMGVAPQLCTLKTVYRAGKLFGRDAVSLVFIGRY